MLNSVRKYFTIYYRELAELYKCFNSLHFLLSSLKWFLKKFAKNHRKINRKVLISALFPSESLQPTIYHVFSK